MPGNGCFCYQNTVGLEGLCQILLVFRVIPRLARNIPSETQIMRGDMIDRTAKEITKVLAKIRVTFGLRQVSGPKAIAKSLILRTPCTLSPVVVYRTTIKRWEVPFTFISVDGERSVVQIR